MRARASSILVSALLPLLFVAIAARVLETETWVRAGYGRLGDEPALDKGRRVTLALEGLRAIDPLRDGASSCFVASACPTDRPRSLRRSSVTWRTSACG